MVVFMGPPDAVDNTMHREYSKTPWSRLEPSNLAYSPAGIEQTERNEESGRAHVFNCCMCQARDPECATRFKNTAVIVESRCRICGHQRCGLCFDFLLIQMQTTFSTGEKRQWLCFEGYRPATPEFEIDEYAFVADPPVKSAAENQATPKTPRKRNNKKSEKKGTQEIADAQPLPPEFNHWDTATYGDTEYGIFTQGGLMNVEKNERMGVETIVWKRRSKKNYMFTDKGPAVGGVDL